jgi:hypothetical protein
VRLCRIRVAGLAPEEATQYAGDLLAPYPAAARRRADRAFGELMQWLDGHPLSMRLVLPYLDTTAPKALLAGLHGAAPLPGWDDGQGHRGAPRPAEDGVQLRTIGLLAEARGSPGQALEWMVRCVALFNDFPRPSTGPGPVHLARLTRQLGFPVLEACWQKVTDGPLPGTVRDYVHSYRPDAGDTPEGADR